jgi:C-terminal processing protease CtpA/Prc
VEVKGEVRGHVDGPRYLDRPVYVLTGGRTFSGGEDLAYALQGLGVQPDVLVAEEDAFGTAREAVLEAVRTAKSPAVAEP